MKNYLIVAAIALLSFSCKNGNDPATTQKVAFELLGLDVSSEALAPTRATDTSTPAEVGIKEIWVIEGTKVLLHQYDYEQGFGSPIVDLSVGQHTITFIASGQTGQTYNAGTWSADKANDCFGAVCNINVNASTGPQSIVMMRACYGLRWQSTDIVPSNAVTIRLTIKEYRNGLKAGLIGSTPEQKQWTYPAASIIGKTFNVTVYGLPAQSGVENNITTTIELLDASNMPISRKTKTVPVLCNRRTIITGELLGMQANAAMGINMDWLEDHNETL